MGGRKDDVTRTPTQRKRPLSAVIEEFEVDDPEHRDDNNNDGADENNDANNVDLEMRTQDQLLARQLLTIRSDIYQLKLARSCKRIV
nr:hypothetical protein BaRGS_011101 [Batillaria attramentaria]